MHHFITSTKCPKDGVQRGICFYKQSWVDLTLNVTFLLSFTKGIIHIFKACYFALKEVAI